MDVRGQEVSVKSDDGEEPLARLRTLCKEMAQAVDGKLAHVVATHEELILEYYRDVREQAKESFASARMVAWVGFWILISTLCYALIFDTLTRFQIVSPPIDEASMTITKAGVLSATLIEFIATVNFWLYSRSARQFGAFHICLERTHRYLLAYKIAQETGKEGDATVREIACIMANAPMINRADLASTATPDVAATQSANLPAITHGVTAA